MKKIISKKGFISLFTVLLATVILSISVGMTSIALKQIVLGSTADDANEAFYAADAGLQCAIMNDIMGNFATGANAPINCGSVQSIAINPSGTSFSLTLGGPTGFDWSNGNCVDVTIEKTSSTTKIEALGYNVSCADVNAGQSPKIVERALRVRYGN